MLVGVVVFVLSLAMVKLALSTKRKRQRFLHVLLTPIAFADKSDVTEDDEHRTKDNALTIMSRRWITSLNQGEQPQVARIKQKRSKNTDHVITLQKGQARFQSSQKKERQENDECDQKNASAPYNTQETHNNLRHSAAAHKTRKKLL
jgi:hypothetical protein